MGPRNPAADPSDGHSGRKCLDEGIAFWAAGGTGPAEALAWGAEGERVEGGGWWPRSGGPDRA